MRAVLDANVVISGLLRPEGPPGRILSLLFRGRSFESIASPYTFAELRRSLRYPKVAKYLHLTGREIDLWVDAYASISVLVEGRVIERVVPGDPADDIYIAAAVEGLANFIVSGDRHLLDLGERAGIPILAPRSFLDLGFSPNRGSPR